MGAIVLTVPFMAIDYIYVTIAFILWLKNLFTIYKRNGSSLELYKEQLKKAGIICCIWISGINIPYFVCMKIHRNKVYAIYKCHTKRTYSYTKSKYTYNNNTY